MKRSRLEIALAAIGILVATLGLAALLTSCAAHGRAAPAPVTLDVGAGLVASNGRG